MGREETPLLFSTSLRSHPHHLVHLQESSSDCLDVCLENGTMPSKSVGVPIGLPTEMIPQTFTTAFSTTPRFELGRGPCKDERAQSTDNLSSLTRRNA